MSQIPYLIKKHSILELEKEGFDLKLMKESFGQPYELKQMIPVVSEGDTESVYSIFAINHNLIKTFIHINKETYSDKYLTAEQIELLKKLGSIEINGEKREINNITIQWDQDSVYNITAEIELK